MTTGQGSCRPLGPMHVHSDMAWAPMLTWWVHACMVKPMPSSAVVSKRQALKGLTTVTWKVTPSYTWFLYPLCTNAMEGPHGAPFENHSTARRIRGSVGHGYTHMSQEWPQPLNAIVTAKRANGCACQCFKEGRNAQTFTCLDNKWQLQTEPFPTFDHSCSVVTHTSIRSRVTSNESGNL